MGKCMQSTNISKLFVMLNIDYLFELRYVFPHAFPNISYLQKYASNIYYVALVWDAYAS